MINDSILWTVSPLSCRVYMVKIAFDIGFFGVLTYWVDFIGTPCTTGLGGIPCKGSFK